MNLSALPTTCALASWLIAQDLRPVDAPRVHFDVGCFDSTRDRTVLVGQAHDTWEWDGTSWLRRPFLGPTSAEKILVHDPLRRATYSFSSGQVGGPLIVWSYDGASWQPVVSAPTPSSRGEMALAFDSARGEVVLFGGRDPWTLGGLSDTWTFDGTTWSQRFPATAPPARYGAAIADDRTRQRLVLFGGQASGLLQDTWEWDGTTWQQRPTPASPSPRLAPAMAFDPLRQRCVLFGGLAGLASSDTWEFDGTNWTNVIPAGPVPPARWSAALAFDDTLGEVTLFGGIAGGPLGFGTHDHWSWNGTRWLRLSDRGPKPSPREGAALVSEPGGATVLLFGGADVGATHADTWRWDGTTWTALPAPGPSARTLAAMFRHQTAVYLFGGLSGSGIAVGDTWRWNGATWTQLAPSPSPSPRYLTGVAYDLANNVAVLFGGSDNGTALGETWTFDGTNWQLRAVPAPSPRMRHAMAYDPWRSVTVLFGGAGPGFLQLDDTWEWNGSTWQLQNPTHRPPATGTASMDFDLTRQRLVLVPAQAAGPVSAWQYDGIDWQSIPLAHDHWLGYTPQVATAPGWRGVVVTGFGNLFELSPTPARATEHGIACGVGAPRLSASTWPSPGAAFGLDAIGNDSNSLVAFVGAVAAANLPLAGCSLLVTPGQMLVLSLANPHGFAHLGLPLPNSTAYLGIDLFFQAASLRASAPAGFVMSRGLQITIGD